MKKKHLEITLQKLRELPSPIPELEQYPTPADIGADLIFRAFTRGDIKGKRIVEPGCGKGLLCLGAGIMGAESITGFDSDEKAVEIARKNSEILDSMGYEIKGNFFCGKFPGFVTGEKWDTVLMNPPFGSQKREADRPFLDFSVEHANVIYSLHLAKTINFLRSYLGSLGFDAEFLGYYRFPIRHVFHFHTREVVEQRVVVVRSEKI